MEHMAFRAEDMDAFVSKLEERGIADELFPFEALEIVLVFLRDPDGNRIHVDFPADEKAWGTVLSRNSVSQLSPEAVICAKRSE